MVEKGKVRESVDRNDTPNGEIAAVEVNRRKVRFKRRVSCKSGKVGSR